MVRVLELWLVLAIGVGGLDAQEPDDGAARAAKDLRAIVARKVAPAEQAARNEEVAAWLEKHASTDLGAHGWMRPLALYFGRDVEGACAGLLAWIDEHGELPKDEDFAPITGRIFLGAAAVAVRDAAWERYDRCTKLALELYPQRATIYRALGASLATAESAESFARWKTLASALLLDESVTDAERVKILSGALGVRAPKAALKPFKKRTMGGEEIALEDWKGRVVLVDFWATWCPPCMKEMPNVVALYEQHHGEGLEILGVSLDREGAEELIHSAEKKLGMRWPQIYDGQHWDAELAKANGIDAIPATYLYDRAGKLRYTNLKGDALEKRVRELLAEKR